MYGLDISRETYARLKKYQLLLEKWNDKINLVSKSTLIDSWNRHFLDSLQLMQFIQSRDTSLVDVGSGAGFPGIVLSIAGIKSVTVIETDSRKAAFLLQAAQLSSNKIEVVNKRAEGVKMECDVLTARAFASVSDILECTRNIVVRDKYLLLKGSSFSNEMLNVGLKYKVHDSITSKDGRILEVKCG